MRRHCVLRFIDELEKNLAKKQEKKHTHTEQTPQKKTPSNSGSILLMSEKSYRQAVRAGRCPVEEALARYEWPVRSAVVASLSVAFSSKRVRAAFRASSDVQQFMNAAVEALRVSYDYRQKRRELGQLYYRGDYEIKPKMIQPRAVVRALRALTRGLHWLNGRGGCPEAVRPHLARLVTSLYTSGLGVI